MIGVKIENEILTVGLIGAVFAMTTAIAAFALRVAPATGACVLWTGQRLVQWMTCGMQMAVALIAAVCAIDMSVAVYRTIEARLIAKELIPAAVIGG